MTMMNQALNIAVNIDDVLFPHMAMDILKDVYGNRLDNMRPVTIAEKVISLCMKNGYEPEDDDVIESVNDFINT